MASITKPMLRAILYFLGLLVLFSLLNFFMSIHPPKFKTNDNPEKHGLEYENITFKTTDGLTLRGWFIPNNKTKKAIIVGHGYPFDKNNILGMATFLADEYNLLYYDFRYFGESDGKITTVGAKDRADVDNAVKFLKKRGMEGIGAMGFSMSAATFIMADHPEIKAIVADSSYSSLEDILMKSFWFFGPLKYPLTWMTKLWGRIFFGMNIKDVSPTESVKKSETPVLLIHGDKDSQIPVEHSRKIHEAGNSTELWIVKGADHGQAHAFKKAEYEKRVNDFFQDTLK